MTKVQITDLVLPAGPRGEKGEKGDPGARGPQGLPGVNAVPADSAVASYLTGDGTATRAAAATAMAEIASDPTSPFAAQQEARIAEVAPPLAKPGMTLPVGSIVVNGRGEVTKIIGAGDGSGEEAGEVTLSASTDPEHMERGIRASSVAGIAVDDDGDVPLTVDLLGAARKGAVEPGHAVGYVYHADPASQNTYNPHGNNTARVTPYFVAEPIHIASLALEVIVAGEAGAKAQIIVHADNGSGAPGATVFVSGLLAADVANSWAEVATDLTLMPGRYHVGAVVRNAPTTQPQFRFVSIPQVPYTFTAKPAAGAGVQRSYVATNVATTYPATFPSGAPGPGGPRLLVQIDGTLNVDPGITFDARVASAGFDRYKVVNPAALDIVNDPVLGASRKVIRMVVDDEDTNLTSNPRAQLSSPNRLKAGTEFWWGYSVYLPASFPNVPAGQWLTLSEFYGQPYGGTSPFRVAVAGSNLVIRRNATYGFTNLATLPLVRDTWIDLVIHVKLSEDPAEGFVQVEVNTGAGWTPWVPKTFMKTLDDSNNEGLQHTALKLYRSKGWVDQITCYFADHKVGINRAVVLPTTR